VWTWRLLAAEAGTSKIIGGDSGLHNKPAGYGASEANASGPGSEEEEEEEEEEEARWIQSTPFRSVYSR
jgi:hypothetical protein